MPLDRLKEVVKCTNAANQKFFTEGRELFVSFARPALDNAIVAWVRLNKAEEIKSSDPSVDLYLGILQTAFLTLFDKEGVLVPIADVTSLGWDVVEAMRRKTGVGVETLPTPAPVLTSQQTLEETIKSDWKKLSATQLRKKINSDLAYREVFETLSNTGGLDSAVTTHVVIPGA